METAKAAGAPPNVSSGKVYMLTLNAATAKMPSEMPANAQAALGARGRASVNSASTEAARQTRKRAATVEIAPAPRSAIRSDNHPPETPPKPAKSGGTQAYHADCCCVRWCTSTRYSVVQLNQR